MKNITQHDILALNRAIGEIYAARDMEMFYRSAFSSIQSLIPGELYSGSEVSIHPIRFLKLISASQEHDNVSTKFLPALNAHLHEHPLVPRFFSDTVSKTTDHASKRQFKNLAIYNEYYRHLDVETQIGFSIPLSPEKVALFALSRKNPDYSERDKLILTLLRPHLMSALRNVTELGRMRLERDLLCKGAEVERQGAILLQSDGIILCLSPFAKEICGRYFAANIVEGDTLPERLLQWFNAEANPSSPPCADRGDLKKSRASGGFPAKVEREPLLVEVDGRRLKIKLVHDFTSGEYVLVIIETDPFLSLHDLQGYGLSSREAEVLQWLAKGKTNGEIAIILSISKRTADKHLENIFAKLGVETRAAAAAIMRKE